MLMAWRLGNPFLTRVAFQPPGQRYQGGFFAEKFESRPLEPTPVSSASAPCEGAEAAALTRPLLFWRSFRPVRGVGDQRFEARVTVQGLQVGVGCNRFRPS
jgi:hypothetical protein